MTSLLSPLKLEEYQALVNGIPKNCPNAIFTIGGLTLTAPQATSYITNVLVAVNATAAAKTGWKDARMAEEKVLAQDGATVRGIRDTIELMFTNSTTTLAEFLIAPRKPYKPLSTAARAAATAKARATRLARGTKSKTALAAITGNVTGVTITPILSGTAASAAPAAVTSPGGPAPVSGTPVASAAPAAAGVSGLSIGSGTAVAAAVAPRS